MRAISWNVNSLRTRLERVAGVLERHRPDLLCIQETKVQNEDFPHQAFADLGYQAVVHGQKSYNGVAICSRQAVADVRYGFPGDPAPKQARVLSCLYGGVRWINVYVINGKAIDTDPFHLKMTWLTALRQWINTEFSAQAPLVLLGDFNIVPDDRDVYDPEGWRDHIHCSDAERTELQSLQAWGLADLYRIHHQSAGLYSWWDYRAGAFPRDHGLRIDLALGTACVAARCSGSHLDRAERETTLHLSKPSDHVPLLIDLS